MIQLPLIKTNSMARILEHLGFEKVDQVGNHTFFLHADGHKTTLPLQRGRFLAYPLLNEIIKQIGLGPEQLGKLLVDLKITKEKKTVSS